MMINFLQRSFTAFALFFVIYFALNNNIFLFLFLIIISFIVLIEFYNLLKKNVLINKRIISCIYLISIFYLCVVMAQLYYFLTFDLKQKIIFIYLLTTCISTDLGGYMFGKLFKGKN